MKKLAIKSVLGLFFCLPVGAETPFAPKLEVSGADVRQGQALQVKFCEAEPGLYRLQVAGQSHALFPQGSCALAFVGIPADQKPGGYTLRIVDAQGQPVATQKIEVYPGRFQTQHIRFYTPALSPEQQAVIAEENALMDQARQGSETAALWQGAFMLPVPHRISAVYGTRRYLNGKYNGYHSGVDFASPMAYPVKAPAAGKVSLARYFSKHNANGNTVFLDHGLGVTSVYIHLSQISVQEGQTVTQGQTLGLIGSTGRSTGPHLHWGVYLNGQNTDGLAWIKFTQTALKSQP